MDLTTPMAPTLWPVTEAAQGVFDTALLAYRWRTLCEKGIQKTEKSLPDSQQGTGASVLQIQGAEFCQQP